MYGSDRVLAASVDALVQAGHQVTVALPALGALAERLEEAGASVVVVPTPVLRKSALRPAGAARLVADAVRGLLAGARLLRRMRPRALYVSTQTIPLWLLLGCLGRVPTVCHLHEAETGASPPIRVALAAPLLLAGTVVANSRFSRDVMVDAVPVLRARTTVVANPVPGPSRVRPPRPEAVPPVRVLYVGRLSPRKGPQIAVEAVARLVDDGRDVRLDLLGSVFVGYEWFEDELRDEIDRRRLGGRIRLVGFRDDPAESLADADVVVVPSLADEPFGNTAVEAVLAHRPVVVSSTGGLPEAVEGYACARTVTPGDAGALADAISGLLDGWAEVTAGTDAAAALATERHDPSRYASRLVDVVERQVELGRRTAR